MARNISRYLLVCSLVAAGPWGCAGSRLQPIDTMMFVPPAIQKTPDSNAIELPKASVASEIEPGPVQGESPKNASILPPPTPRPFDALKPLDELPASPTTAPSPQSADASLPSSPAPLLPPSVDPTIVGQGVYMTLGCVLAQVNNTPIYANQVLSPLNKEFTAKAREMDTATFHDFAEGEIVRQLRELIDDERYFATAFHALNAEDRQLADGVVAQVRHDKVIAAGGSESVARQQALDDGEEFDESLKTEYRRVVSEIYKRRRIDPLVHVTADQMREYYRLHLAKLYSTKDRAQFRVLAINPANCGGMKAAMEKITALRERAAHGEDFTALASTVNDDDFLKSRGGNPCDDGGWMERNTYRIDEVEAAVWQIQPGQITPVIQADHQLYIAKLEARRNGVTQAFDDLAVQDQIYGQLRQEQFSNLWEKKQTGYGR